MLSLRLLALALASVGMAGTLAAQADAPLPNPPEFPDENPLLPDQDTLGKFLFWDEQMSSDNTMACGTCHIHEAGSSDPRSFTTINPGFDGIFGTDDDVRGSAGVVRHDINDNYVDGGPFGHAVQVTGRKTPPAINAVYFNDIFWDGRATQAYTDPQTGLVEIPYLAALESQAVGPPLSDVEMSDTGRTWDDIVAKLAVVKPMELAINLPPEMVDFLNDYPNYPAMFEAVYGTPDITSKRVAMAIANYERTLISDETVLDDFLKGVFQDFPPGYQEGFDLFQGDANCAACHTLPFTMDNDYHNIGVRPDVEDHGREDFTGDPADRAKFKTPNIRNSELRLPLFHNGSANTVREVIEFYNRGGDFNTEGNLDINIEELNLTESQIDALTFFVADGMTDQRVIDNVFPFTRPTLRSELPSLNSTYGVASVDGLGGTAEVINTHPAFPGNLDFTLGIADAAPSSPAFMIATFLPDPAATVFPNPPVPVNVDLNTLVLDALTTTDADGFASFQLPLPDNPLLSGMKFYTQWFVFDGAAPTGGWYGTEGLEVEIL